MFYVFALPGIAQLFHPRAAQISQLWGHAFFSIIILIPVSVLQTEQIEAEVMQRARKIAPPLIAAGNDHQTSDGRVADYDDGDDADSVGEAQKRSNASTETLEFPQDALKNCGDFFTSQGKVDDTGSPPEGRKKQPMSNGIEGAWSALEEDDEIVTVDKLLDEALCASAAGEEDSENVAKRRDGSIEFQSEAQCQYLAVPTTLGRATEARSCHRRCNSKN